MNRMNKFFIGEENLTWSNVVKTVDIYKRNYNIHKRSEGKENESSSILNIFVIEHEDDEGDKNYYDLGDNDDDADEENEAFFTYDDDF